MHTYYWNPPGRPFTKVEVARINIDSGVLDWRKEYFFNTIFGTIPTINEQSMGLDLLDDGSIIIHGGTVYYGFVGAIMKLDQNGDSVWARNIEYTHGTNDDMHFRDLEPTMDGGFVCIGQFVDYSIGKLSTWVVKLDSLGCDTPGCQYAAIKKLEKSHIYPS